MTKLKWIIASLFFMLISCGLVTLPVLAGSIYDSPYVTLSPDRKAFTTNANDKNCTQYNHGTTVRTHIPSTMRALKEGEHFYKYNNQGIIPVEKWVVAHKYAQCIHGGYPTENEYHGVPFGRARCGSYYYSGWTAYCADCHELISPMLVYMSMEAARSITKLDLSMVYYYLCPFCRNLEQGSPYTAHSCDKISWNKYIVHYNKNQPAGSLVGGYMQYSSHMYNNATEYRGSAITPSTRLTRNSYTCTGYEFTGWNTKADGTGESYSDTQEIWNLTAENYEGDEKGIVILYAQWKESESILNINPNGGTYHGKSGITPLVGTYLSSITINTASIIPPAGYKVRFETRGGNIVPDITGTRSFTGWRMSQPFHGKLTGNTYQYLGKKGSSDTITAEYSKNAIVLPSAYKRDSSFGGWYYDSECTKPAGIAGDKITPDTNLTLYAKWVDLVLTAKDNYSANSKKGAVDLSWTQNDGLNKTYMLYQSTDNKNWTRIIGVNDISDSKIVEHTFHYSGASGQQYRVPYTGIYVITAYGAEGGRYQSYTGGNGGSVTGKLWLRLGEIVTFTIGGQNGYNGGGSGAMFANGGGYTIVSTNLKKDILIAGGGGGASSMGNGGVGGSTASNISTGMNGQSGEAGGGGGYLGGSAGELVHHWHNNDICQHKHTGDPIDGEGCYSIPKTCGSIIFQQIYDGFTSYYGNIYYDSSSGTWKSDGFCPRCGTKGYCNGPHKDNLYKYECNTCRKDFGREKPIICDGNYGYDVGCGSTGEYICGFANGQILSSKPAYGGSNYVNTAYATDYSSESGKRSGNGLIIIKADHIGYLDTQILEGVTAADKAPPDAIGLSSIWKTALSGEQITISWQKPKDNGTIYYHRAESYLQGSNNKLCDSNVTANTLTSGIMGYYYLVNSSPTTIVNSHNGTLIKQPDAPSVKTKLNDGRQYFHVAAIDIAGNISDTRHVQIGKEDTEIAWNLETEKIGISLSEQGYENIYPAVSSDTYYVKSDGTTPFDLSFNSKVGQARADYQVNKTIFHIKGDSEEQQYIVHTKNHRVTGETIVTRASELEKSTTGTTILQDAAYTITTRRDNARQLHILQRFTLSASYHNRKVRVTPIAGADFGNTLQYSDWNNDLKNSIWLIGDGEAPSIFGTAILEGLDLINRSNGSMELRLEAKDSLSGVREFYVEIINTDNYVIKKYGADGENKIQLEITNDEPIFSGDFRITVCAVDNVGNARTEMFGTTEFSLSTQVTRMLAPHTPIFKTGESGILNIITYGYVDRVEVEFPAEMTALNPELNTCFYYTDTPSYRHEENLRFMVPLDSPENMSFVITVRAYKGDKKLEDYPSLSTIGVDGSVLDEIRTRLRVPLN